MDKCRRGSHTQLAFLLPSSNNLANVYDCCRVPGLIPPLAVSLQAIGECPPSHERAPLGRRRARTGRHAAPRVHSAGVFLPWEKEESLEAGPGTDRATTPCRHMTRWPGVRSSERVSGADGWIMDGWSCGCSVHL